MSLAGSDESHASVGEYEIAVAMAPVGDPPHEPSFPSQGSAARPGFDQTSGRHATGRSSLLAKGDEAVKVATEAIARQVGLAAQRIAEAIDTETISSSGPNALNLESVEISFGVTLSTGVEALFTAKSESSAEVTIVLSRRSFNS
jgi:hypothetical protein